MCQLLDEYIVKYNEKNIGYYYIYDDNSVSFSLNWGSPWDIAEELKELGLHGQLKNLYDCGTDDNEEDNTKEEVDKELLFDCLIGTLKQINGSEDKACSAFIYDMVFLTTDLTIGAPDLYGLSPKNTAERTDAMKIYLYGMICSSIRPACSR